MSFRFNWKFFNVQELQEKCQAAMTASIAESKRPPVMVQPLKVVDINFGTIPPEIAFQSIQQVSVSRVHVVFSLKYSGDANLTMQTLLQANPLIEPLDAKGFPSFVVPEIVAAADSLVIPFQLKLITLELDSLVDVVYTKEGLAVTFRGPPIKKLVVDSTLDGIPGVKAMISEMMKQQLTASFFEDIPETIWTQSSPTKRQPDPTLGPTRWRMQKYPVIRFSELALVRNHIAEKDYFGTLSLQSPIKDCISSRARLRNFDDGQQRGDPVDMADLFEDNASDTSVSSESPRRPRRRVISLRKLSRDSPRPSPERSSFHSPDRQNALSDRHSTDRHSTDWHSTDTERYTPDRRSERPSTDGEPQFTLKDIHNRETPVPKTPPMLPEYALYSPVTSPAPVRRPPRVRSTSSRRYSSPGEHPARKIRTASLQPAKPRLSFLEVGDLDLRVPR